eukprot:scaffold7328_cov314-Pinguiococcus_pyrenoidosus.AAC.47
MARVGVSGASELVVASGTDSPASRIRVGGPLLLAELPGVLERIVRSCLQLLGSPLKVQGRAQRIAALLCAVHIRRRQRRRRAEDEVGHVFASLRCSLVSSASTTAASAWTSSLWRYGPTLPQRKDAEMDSRDEDGQPRSRRRAEAQVAGNEFLVVEFQRIWLKLGQMEWRSAEEMAKNNKQEEDEEEERGERLRTVTGVSGGVGGPKPIVVWVFGCFTQAPKDVCLHGWMVCWRGWAGRWASKMHHAFACRLAASLEVRQELLVSCCLGGCLLAKKKLC